MALRILTLAIWNERDVVASRQRARQIASMLEFGAQDQTRISTAVSEIARNAFKYASEGRIEFLLEGETAPQVLIIQVTDAGPGIGHLDEVLAGRYRSPTGMGMGIIGARRLLDQCDIDTVPGQGTCVTMKKLLPAGVPVVTPARLSHLGASLAPALPDITLFEVQQQNQELMATLSELKARQEELLQLTRELEDTNRGVVALYAELDERADHLRRADEMKSRFLSNMSHEFRTPLSSIRALSRLLLGRADGELNAEQEKQVSYIMKGAEDLSELVNDLLDLAKIEAGKIEIHPARFDVSELFSALRGMLRPLLAARTVDLVFEEPEEPIVLFTDEGKVSQILRNFISNALKFTEKGEVRVSARPDPQNGAVRFSVRDTGLGIAPENQEIIFEEFSQVENRLQRDAKGTGLGLPLCRKLAKLLGGTIELESAPEAGATFSAIFPARYEEPGQFEYTPADNPAVDQNRIPVLIVEDDHHAILLYEKYLRDTPYHPMIARSLREAENIWKTNAPKAVVLDILLGSETAWRWLAELKSDEGRNHVPVLVVTELEDERKAIALGADAYFVKPLFAEELLSTLQQMTVARADQAPTYRDGTLHAAASAVPPDGSSIHTQGNV